MSSISRKLAFHPLSLANVDMSIMRNRATKASKWGEKKKHLLLLLGDERIVPNNPFSYEMPYNLIVGASMMVIVDCIPLSEAHRILDLMSLFEGLGFKQNLFNFFNACIQTSRSNFEFNFLVKYLKDRSLIEKRKQGNKRMLEAHGLRTHYIREEKTRCGEDLCSNLKRQS